MINVQRVPFFNVRYLIISNMADLHTTSFKMLLMNAFPRLERLDLADDFDDDQLAAIFSGTTSSIGALFGCNTDVDQAPTGVAND